jgi:hypothetical protein
MMRRPGRPVELRAARYSTRLRNPLPLLVAVMGVLAGCHYEAYTPTEPALPTYAVRQLGLLAGGSQSQANAGSAVAVVGWATDPGGARHAVSFAGGQVTRLSEPPGSASSEACGITSSGTIVGFATTSAGLRQALLWSTPGATPIRLPSLGGAFTFAAGINDQNTIVGMAQTDTGDTVLVLWQPSGANYGAVRVDSTGGVDAAPTAIDNSLDIVGNLGGAAGAFFWDPVDGFDTVSSPGPGSTAANGLNNYGIQVGTISHGSGPSQAYVYTGTIGTALLGGPPTGYTSVGANAIDDNGIIAGVAWTADASGDTLTSVAVIGTVVNTAATFVTLPTLAGSRAQPSNNGMTKCGVVLGSATNTAGVLPRVAVAWIPSGCTVP